MNDISEVLGALTPSLFTDQNGKEWQVSPPTKKIQGQFSEWLKMRAKQEIFAMQSEISEDMLGIMLSRFAERSARGLYGFFSKFASEMLGKVDGDGLVRLFWLSLQRYTPAITEAEALDLYMDNETGRDALLDMLMRSKNAVAPPAKKG